MRRSLTRRQRHLPCLVVTSCGALGGAVDSRMTSSPRGSSIDGVGSSGRSMACTRAATPTRRSGLERVAHRGERGRDVGCGRHIVIADDADIPWHRATRLGHRPDDADGHVVVRGEDRRDARVPRQAAARLVARRGRPVAVQRRHLSDTSRTDGTAPPGDPLSARVPGHGTGNMMDVLVSEREEVLGGLLRVALPGHQHRDDVRRPEARHVAEDEDGDLDAEVDLRQGRWVRR